MERDPIEIGARYKVTFPLDGVSFIATPTRWHGKYLYFLTPFGHGEQLTEPYVNRDTWERVD